jgi:hypothetical protein
VSGIGIAWGGCGGDGGSGRLTGSGTAARGAGAGAGGATLAALAANCACKPCGTPVTCTAGVCAGDVFAACRLADFTMLEITPMITIPNHASGSRSLRCLNGYFGGAGGIGGGVVVSGPSRLPPIDERISLSA